MRKAVFVSAVGAALALVGFYFASDSGLLFGFSCYLGLPACETLREQMMPEFLEGIFLLALGIMLAIIGTFLLLKRRNKPSIAQAGAAIEVAHPAHTLPIFGHEFINWKHGVISCANFARLAAPTTL